MEQEIKEVKKSNKTLLTIIVILLVLTLLTITGIVSFNLGKSLAHEEAQLAEKDKEKNDKTETPEYKDDKKVDANTRPKIVGTTYEEFNKIINNTATKKAYKEIEGYPSFILNRIHSTEAGAFGDGYQELYYFDEDGTYLMDISDYEVAKETVVYAGTWEIKDNKLTLNQKYILTQVNGTKGEVPVPGGTFTTANKEYDFEVKQVTNKTTYTITHIGVSQYKQDMLGEETPLDKLLPDNYKLDSKDWYSLEDQDILNMLDNVKEYYDALNK